MKGTNNTRMGAINEHKRRIKEHLDEINDAIDFGMEKKPVTIGFHTSACASEILELYLHKMNLISVGKMIKHNWFERPQYGQKIAPLIDRKLPVVFPDKEKIYDLIHSIEENRDVLIYGKATKSNVEVVIKKFSELKNILKEKLSDLGEEIE